jgi:hypothetical protein
MSVLYKFRQPGFQPNFDKWPAFSLREDCTIQFGLNIHLCQIKSELLQLKHSQPTPAMRLEVNDQLAFAQ